MNWGKWIVLSFVLFAIFIGVLATICIRQDVNLVSKNYYQEELAFQKQIDRMENTDLLADKPIIALKGSRLEIAYGQFRNIEKGELKLFRPSDVRLDKQVVRLTSEDSVQGFDISTLPKGMYYARMKWSMKGKEYFLENSITL